MWEKKYRLIGEFRQKQLKDVTRKFDKLLNSWVASEAPAHLTQISNLLHDALNAEINARRDLKRLGRLL